MTSLCRKGRFEQRESLFKPFWHWIFGTWFRDELSSSCAAKVQQQQMCFVQIAQETLLHTEHLFCYWNQDLVPSDESYFSCETLTATQNRICSMIPAAWKQGWQESGTFLLAWFNKTFLGLFMVSLCRERFCNFFLGQKEDNLEFEEKTTLAKKRRRSEETSTWLERQR